MTDTVGVLTEEEFEILPEQAQLAFGGSSDLRYGWQFRELITCLCYELAQSKLEVRSLRDESL